MILVPPSRAMSELRNPPQESTSDVLDTSIFEDPDFGEVFRSLEFTLRVTKTTTDINHPTRPAIHFVGEMPDVSTSMRGTVNMTPDDQIHWHFVYFFILHDAIYLIWFYSFLATKIILCGGLIIMPFSLSYNPDISRWQF